MEQADLRNAASNGESSGRAGLCNGLDRHCIKSYRLIRVGFESLPVPLFMVSMDKVDEAGRTSIKKRPEYAERRASILSLSYCAAGRVRDTGAHHPLMGCWLVITKSLGGQARPLDKPKSQPTPTLTRGYRSMTKVLRGDRCQCAACKEYFNSTYAFDKHRIGKYGVNRHCMSVNRMYQAGMAMNKAGFWISKAYIEPEKGR